MKYGWSERTSFSPKILEKSTAQKDRATREKGPATELRTYTLYCGVLVTSYWSQLRPFIPNRPLVPVTGVPYPTAQDPCLEAGTVCGVVVAGSAATSMSMNPWAWGGSSSLYLRECVTDCSWAGAQSLFLFPCSPILLSCGFLHYLKSAPAHDHSVTQVLACYMDDGAPTISMHASVYIYQCAKME